MYLVEDLYWKYKSRLSLQLVAGKEGLKKRVLVPEVRRPGIALTGYLKGYTGKRILAFGKVEIEYLYDLPPSDRKERLKTLLSMSVSS